MYGTIAMTDITEGGVMAPVRAEAAEHGWRVLGILSALMGFASISTDLYLPAMPTMGIALHADQGAVELTVSAYLTGFSLGMLAWGPIGDRYGRRTPIAIGLVLFVIGSAGCAMTGGIGAMVGWRIVQALGACASVVLSRAMVRDLYQGDRAAQMMSTLLTVMAIAPLLGPLVGGQILALAGWRAIFWTLVGVGTVTLAALYTLPETLPVERRNREPLTSAFASYVLLLRDRSLLGYAGAGGFFYAGMFAYVAGSPFAYIGYHHVPAQLYGLLFGAGVIGIMGANLVNARAIGRFGSDRLLRWGTIAATATALILAVDAWSGFGGLAGLAVPLFAFATTTGFIVANAITGAMVLFPNRSGTVSALIGATQYGSGMVGSALVGVFADGTPWPMAWVVAVCAIGSLVSTWLIVAGRRPTSGPGGMR
jgi:DHA1 family bicyclomycin/chloramphenicol resistance-like MFS transporter